MRPFLQFLGFCFIVFFIVGEFQGWYAGVATRTPMFLYKMTRDVEVTREVSEDELNLRFSGKVRDGTVGLEVYFEIPPSFQGGTIGKPPKKIFEEAFLTGQTIDLQETLKSGKGRYIVRIIYNQATGTFRLNASGQGQL
ncbi:MAG: hypothetical protein ACRCYY_02125 [Trueperaceae bacterium]